MLAVTGGHSFDLDAFRTMFTDICEPRGWAWAHAVQPSAQHWFDGQWSGQWDAIVCHDIPGLHLKRGEPPRPIGPTDQQKHAITSLLDSGQGLVITHHALAGWPAWDGWATAIGGRFNYAPGPLHGDDWPSSGTRIDTYSAVVVDRAHPVCEGVDDFTFTDELYCCPIFEDQVIPLMRSDADFDPSRFISTYEHVIVGEEAAPKSVGHPPAEQPHRLGHRRRAQPDRVHPARRHGGHVRAPGVPPVARQCHRLGCLAGSQGVGWIEPGSDRLELVERQNNRGGSP